MRDIKKRHHYIPEFYLRKFVDHVSGMFWMYQKHCEIVKPISPHNAAVITYYYSFKDDKGELDNNTFENIMAGIEGESAPIFDKIENQEKLTENERRIFSLFLSLIRIRVPNFRNNVENSGAEVIKITMKRMASNEERFRSILEEYMENTGEKIDIPFDDLRNFALDDSKYMVKINPIFSLFVGLNMALSLSDWIFDMKWKFLLSTKDNEFLTSDNPLVITNPSDRTGAPVGLLLRNAILSFPISKNIALYAYWSDNNYIEYINAVNNEVKEINRMTVINSRRFIFCSKKLSGIKILVDKYSDYVPKTEVIDNPPFIRLVNRPY